MFIKGGLQNDSVTIKTLTGTRLLADTEMTPELFFNIEMNVADL
jgi:hypothetical protein